MPKGQRFCVPIHVAIAGETLEFLLACGHTTSRARALWPHWQEGDVSFPVRRLRCTDCDATRPPSPLAGRPAC